MILLSWVSFIPWYDVGNIITGDACGAGNANPSGGPDFISAFHRGSCYPVTVASLFYVIVLSFGFWVLIVPFVWLLGIYIFYFFQILKLMLPEEPLSVKIVTFFKTCTRMIKTHKNSCSVWLCLLYFWIQNL